MEVDGLPSPPPLYPRPWRERHHGLGAPISGGTVGGGGEVHHHYCLCGEGGGIDGESEFHH